MKFNTYIPKDNFKNLKNTKIKEYDEKYLDIEKEIEKSYTDKCKDDNEQYVSIEDIHRLINGMYLSDDSKKELGIIKRYLEKLIIIIERSRIRDYMYLTDSKRRLFIINFIAGLGKGFGQAIGFTILAAIVLGLLFSWVDLPIVGRYIAKLLNIVQQYRK
ncbi:hypothetical protein H9L25_05360 [Terrisporobacter mayombei]|nr:hypothetical protein [Terrisporobacter mayombei]